MPPEPLVGIFLPEEPEMHVEVLEAITKGLQATGANYFRARLDGGWRPCDVTVTFGVHKKATKRGQLVGEVLKAHRKSGGRCLVVERGFLHRDRYFMVGWDGLNGRADFCNQNSPDDRWRALHIPVAPWRREGEHIVLSGQVPWDASVQHTDHVAWCQNTAKRLQTLTDRPVVFRPHPCQPTAIEMNATCVHFSQAPTLQAELQEAWALVTFNSNSGVEGALAGCPVFAFDQGSMALAVANRDLRHIESPEMPARDQWLFDLAYTQWTIGEMQLGLPWIRLKQGACIPQKSVWYSWLKKRLSRHIA